MRYNFQNYRLRARRSHTYYSFLSVFFLGQPTKQGSKEKKSSKHLDWKVLFCVVFVCRFSFSWERTEKCAQELWMNVVSTQYHRKRHESCTDWGNTVTRPVSRSQAIHQLSYRQRSSSLTSFSSLHLATTVRVLWAVEKVDWGRGCNAKPHQPPCIYISVNPQRMYYLLVYVSPFHVFVCSLLYSYWLDRSQRRAADADVHRNFS